PPQPQRRRRAVAPDLEITWPWPRREPLSCSLAVGLSCWPGSAVGRELNHPQVRDSMAYGKYQGRYGGRGPTCHGIGSGPIFAIGLMMLAVGALVVVHALVSGARLPPPGAQQIPATVSTAVPFPVDPSKVAPPLPPSTPVLIEIPAVAVRAPVMRLGRNSDGTLAVPPLDDRHLARLDDRGPLPPHQR